MVDVWRREFSADVRLIVTVMAWRQLWQIERATQKQTRRMPWVSQLEKSTIPQPINFLLAE
jgi:hypothetical protein